MHKTILTIVLLLMVTSSAFCEPDFSGLIGAIGSASNNSARNRNQDEIAEVRKLVTELAYRMDRIEKKLGLGEFEKNLTARTVVEKLKTMDEAQRGEYLVNNAIHIDPNLGINVDEWRVISCYISKEDQRRVHRLLYYLQLTFERERSRSEKRADSDWYKAQKSELKAADLW